jgi:ribosomal protein L11 methyltransferase
MPPDRWLELTVRCPIEPELVSVVLLDLGGSAVEETGGALVTYVPPPPDLDAFLLRAREGLERLSASTQFDLSWRWQPQEDWERLWRRGLGPRQITPRLTVTPSWEAMEPGPGEVVLTLDPGMAFGTAEHATTRGCLRMLDKTLEPGVRLADVGSGSGILAIAAVLLGAREVLAMEMDEMSCDTAAENLVRNGVQALVDIRQVRVEGGAALAEAPFDGIVANLQSHLILPLLSAFRMSLNVQGWLILSGILSTERDEVQSAALQEGFLLLEEDEEDGWWTGVFTFARSAR